MEKLEIDQQLRSIHNSNLTTAPAFPPPRRMDRYLITFNLVIPNQVASFCKVSGAIVLNQIVLVIVIVEV